jgi:hypothetical protein
VAEVPAITKVTLAGRRRLRFEFTPRVKTSSWKVLDANSGALLHQGRYPEVQFPDTAMEGEYLFAPEGVTPVKPMKITFNFGTTEDRLNAGLSWRDNYYTPLSDIPFSLKEPYAVDEWVGLPDDDPEIIEAKRILASQPVDLSAPPWERAQQVFLFIMKSIKNATGTPSDEVQAASPLKTYRMLSSGKGKGWCENNALVYYLFANAAGVKTRLVDRAGKFGPLKLTGHYFCESFIPEYAKWVYVDAMINIAFIRNIDGIPLHTVDLKKLTDLHALNGCTALAYDKEGDTLAVKAADEYYPRIRRGLTGEIVLAYKFGYGRNKSYCKTGNFLNYTTLLYAPFALPKRYLVKFAFLYGLYISAVLAILTGLCLVVLKRRNLPH